MLRLILVFLILIFGGYYAVKRGAFGALLLYLWVAYFRPETWVWDGELIRAMNLSLIFGIILLVRSIGSSLRFDFRTGLIFSFLALTVISTMASDHPQWLQWQDFIKAILVSYLMSAVITNVSQLRIALLVIGVSLGFEAAKQGWVVMLLHPAQKNENTLPMLGDNNGVAVGMLMLVPVLVALAQTATKRWEKWTHRFFAVGVTYRAISTFSRGGFLSAGALLIVSVLRSKRKSAGLIGAAVVSTAVLSVLPQEFWDRMSTIKTAQDQVTEENTNIEDGDEVSSLSRLHFWRVAQAMAAANPIVGVGFNAYNAYFDDYDFLRGAFGTGRSVHSSWFGVLAELGYTGLALYIGLLLSSLWACEKVIRRVRKGELPIEFRFYAVALQTGFVPFIVGGSFVPWQYCEMLWHFFGLSLALTAVAEKHAALAPVLAAEPALAPAPAPQSHPLLRPTPIVPRA